jgi:hypothetical protein
MERTPYAYDFLWHQIFLGYENIRKEKYKKLLEKFLKNEDLRNKLNKKEEKKVRKYKGGLLEKTASVLSLSLCIYDNYPEIDIDLLLTAIILNLYSSLYTKSQFYDYIKDYPEVIPFLYRKKRKKPILEVMIFDSLNKFDDMVIKNLIKRREKDGG